MRSLFLVAFVAAIQSTGAKSADSPVGRAIEDIPEALRLIRTAEQVYILPVTLSEDRQHLVTPHGNFRHLRRVSADARRKLQRLLGAERNWFHGFDNTVSVGYDRRTVGFIFRDGGDKLVLLCGLGARLEGTFNGQRTGGSLEFKQSDKLEQWKKQYAKPELSNET